MSCSGKRRCTGSWKPAFCRLPVKGTSEITYLRAYATVIACLSMVSVVLHVCILGLDDSYSVHNMQNVYLLNKSLPVEGEGLMSTASTAENLTLLFPEVEATVGLHTACIGYNCFPRHSLSGVLALVADAAQGIEGLSLPSEFEAAYQEATYQYIFGFDVGAHCGTSRTKTQLFCNAGVVVLALSLLLLLALLAISMVLCSLLGKADLVATNTTAYEDFQLRNFDDLDAPRPCMVHNTNGQLRMRRRLLVSAGILSSLVFCMNVSTFSVTLALNRRNSKCGKAVCAAFEQRMEDFYKLADSLGVNVSTPRAYTCQEGSSYILAIVILCVSGVCFTAGSAVLFCYCCSRHHETKSGMRNRLRGMTEMQDGAYDRTGVSAESRRESAVTNKSLLVPMSNASQEYSEMGNNKSFADDEVGWSRHGGNTAEDTQLSFRRVSAEGELPHLDKQFMEKEDDSRQYIMMSETVEFQVVLALRDTLLQAEKLYRFYSFTLKWHLFSVFHICVMETQSRQQLIRDYDVGVAEVLSSLSDNTEVGPYELYQPRGEGGNESELSVHRLARSF
ncbi:hypothetical protein, unknown function [Leishmania tarentolae]|uniref:Uncharacterized protein n=1 Tax=Leishmania tarentolae TaxID=5689 RepID=A0A640KVY5_LEITA|nr:hypothetical protein, unknown function [Leishmania tarentolae]